MRTTLISLLVACSLQTVAHADDVFSNNRFGVEQQQPAAEPLQPGAEQFQPSAEQQPAGDGLQPGEYRWFETVATPGEVIVVVGLRDQRATVYRNGTPIAVSTISSGRPGMETPTGVFPILQKKKMHHSNRYDNAPMPFMQRLTWDGVAMHAGRIPGHPASHGCVRLPKEFAERLYQVTAHGQIVVVSEDGSIESLARVGLPQYLATMIGTQALPASLDVGDVLPALQNGGNDSNTMSIGPFAAQR